MNFKIVVGIALMFTVSGQVHAEGLVTRLPVDGSWAQYSLRGTIVQSNPDVAGEVVSEGTLTIASVGREIFKGKHCRWIELRTKATFSNGAEVHGVFKGLIPENAIRIGGDSTDDWIKGWLKTNDREPTALDQQTLVHPRFQMNSWITLPLTETKALPERAIDTGIGRFRSSGLSGLITLSDASERTEAGKSLTKDATVTIEARYHEKAPFGTTWMRQEYQGADFSDQKGPRTETTVTLQSVGTDAKSDLPMHN